MKIGIGPSPGAYTGVASHQPPDIVVIDRQPTSRDSENYTIGQFWLYQSTNTLYQLQALSGGSATWVPLGGGAGTVTNLRGDDSMTVPPDGSGIIDVVGASASGITTFKDGTNTLAITSSGGGAFAQTITTGDSNAVPPDSNGNWNMPDGQLISTIGTIGTNTVTINIADGMDGQVPIASSSGNTIYNTLTAGTGISIVNGANSITISASGSSGTIVDVQTTDATPTAFYTSTALTASQALVISADIVAAQSDYSASLIGNINGGGRRGTAGSTTIVGSPTANYSEDFTGSPSIYLDASSNSVRVMVVGVAATTINWRGFITFTLQDT